MEITNIKELLVSNGYIESALRVKNKEFKIPQLYIKQDKEAYLLLEYRLLGEKLNEYQNEFLWFQNFSDNEVIKYNINILILYKHSEIKDEDSLIHDIRKYERDLNVCRKIFVDLDEEGSLNSIPFLEIKGEVREEEEKKMIEEIKDILGNNELIEELNKDNPNLESIKDNLNKEK